MSTGTVKFFNSAKGFGFVTPDGGGVDIFLPAAAVSAAGVATVKPGQRIAFEQAPDTKGPKIVSLNLVGEPPAKAVAPAPVARVVTVYGDAGADSTADVVDAVRASNFTLTLQDLVATPPPADQLKRLSQMLSACGQSLVRRYDPLFFALQLDDRFITDQDFWTAVVEHPALINGPIVVASGRARICKTEDEVQAFLRNDDVAAASKPKTLSPRIAAMLNGGAVPEAEPVTAAPPAPKPVPAKPAPEPVAKPVLKLQIKARPTAEAKKDAVKPAARPIEKIPAKKAAEKPQKAAKKAVAKKAAPAKPAAKKALPKKAAAPAKKARKRA